MTCIIGVVENNKVYIGGDSAGVAGHQIQIRSDEKVFVNGPFVMGFTTSFRMGQLLRYVFKPPVQSCDDDMQFMVKDFIPEIKKCFKEGGFGKDDAGGSFLVGYKGKLFEIHGDFQVALLADNIASVGCGADEALGAMYAMKGMDCSPAEKIIKALEIVCHLNSGVRPPFVVKENEVTKEIDSEPVSPISISITTPRSVRGFITRMLTKN
jgi:ATP-dependent protease HslVU (ClpYQ) peptidase subunit